VEFLNVRPIGTFKNLKNTHCSWRGHTIRHNEFVVNILEGVISGKRPWKDLDCNT
jgi:hypothetical protein